MEVLKTDLAPSVIEMTETQGMTRDFGHLQRLTDQQVQSRLEVYADDGHLEARMRKLWSEAGDSIENAARNYLGQDGDRLLRDHFTKPVDAAWVQAVAKQGMKMFVNNDSVPAFIAATTALAANVVPVIDQLFAGRDEERIEAIDTFYRALAYGEDIVLAQISLLEANAAADARGKQSEQFERRVTDLVRASTDQSKTLTERTRATSTSPLGRFGKTSDGAAAAERS
jgi:methyl-accepting chemotaxis protein